MKASAFDCERAISVDNALEMVSAHGEEARLVGSLLAATNLRLSTPQLVVDGGDLAAKLISDAAIASGDDLILRKISRRPRPCDGIWQRSCSDAAPGRLFVGRGQKGELVDRS